MIKRNKPIKKISEKGKVKRELKKQLIQEDFTFYLSIWEEREHMCQSCGVWLNDEPRTYNFDHLLEKGLTRYQHLRYNKDNIFICCMPCHILKTNGYPTKVLIIQINC